MAKQGLRNASAAMLALALAGCGGGGGGGGGINSTPAPPVTQPGPPAPPTPPPAGSPLVTAQEAEYLASTSALAARAIVAYNEGATGAGVKIAILDSGLSDPRGEFTGRIDPASRDMVAGRGLTDPDGHGTSVTAVAAAGRNTRDMFGMAFDATVLALRTDDVDSCSGDDGCTHSNGVLAQAVDYAVQNSARVINISLGGNAMTPTLRAAIDRATSAGAVIVIAAGNDSAGAPDPFAQIASAPEAHGLVIIAGGVDPNRQINDFSNRAGNFSQYYLAALGSEVHSFDQTGRQFLYSGTSYSTPAIAGAVALLAQAFPNLTSAQIIDLLMRSATDAGDGGTDSVYGRGILDIARAFDPQGGTSLAGGARQVSLGTNVILGPAMGDAQSQSGASLEAVVLDGYQRAYSLDLAATISPALRTRQLARAIGGNVRQTGMDNGRIAVSLTLQRDQHGQPWAGLAQLGLTREDSREARALSGMALMRIDRRTALAFGFAEGGKALTDMLAEDGGAPFLIARDPASTPGFEARRGIAMALRHDLGPVALTVSGEQGRIPAYGRPDRLGETEPGYNQLDIGIDRAFGPLRLAAGLGLLREESTVLGARFSAALGGAGATTRMADIGVRLALGGGWAAGAAWRQGWTKAERGGALEKGALRSTAFAVDIGRSGRADRLGLRVAQPLRVASGGYRLRLPTAYDYVTGAIGYELRTLNLAPKGRELDTELAYGRRLGAGWVDTNLFWRRDPGNIEALPDDIGAVVRFSLGF